MKVRTRILSLLLAMVMVAGFVPWDVLPRAEATDTNLTIDFDYGKNVTTATEALRQKAEAAMTTRKQGDGKTPVIDENYWQSNYNTFKWQHATTWTVNDHDSGSIRDLLMSTDPEDKYISLTASDTHSYNYNAEWETMKITTDKVLDLNGYQMEIKYDSNKRNSDSGQTSIQKYHICTAFEIANGATLTIIDSSAWRGEGDDHMGTGKISFTAYMCDPFKYDIDYYTTRDLFNVTDGNLVIYGGTFQAGRQKDQVKSNFSWGKLKTAIGTAVGLGANIAEYATGVSVAAAKYKDIVASQLDSSVTNSGEENETGSTIKKDGSDAPKETKKDGPEAAGSRDQTIEEKKNKKNEEIENGSNGTKEGANKENAKKPGKDDKNTEVAEGKKAIVDKALDKNAIGGIVDGAFTLAENISSMIGNDWRTRVTQSIKGTVVLVGNKGSFVAYGGKFIGHGDTPNTKNAVIEIANQGGERPWDKSKDQGGLAYIYGGVFEAKAGANVFNMTTTDQNQKALTRVKNQYGTITTEEKTLTKGETNGFKVLYYENQSSGMTETPINTANVQVRGGTFRCYYEPFNVSVRGSNDDEHFRKYPGTPGSVNLGVESFNADLIQDGRIQIVDKYGDGALVLLDERTDERAAALAAGQTFTEGLYHYRLFCGDNELRAKEYLEVYPNTAETNTSHSIQLCTYVGTSRHTSEIFTEDDDNDRSPYRQTENYFDFMIDRKTASNWSVMPNFHYRATASEQEKMDVYGESLENSEIWYYPKPLDADGNPIADVPYGEAYYTAAPKSSAAGSAIRISQMTSSDKVWKDTLKKQVDKNTVKYFADSHEGLRTGMKYFTYKMYRVDPLTRENISESSTYGVDEPLIEVRYGAGANDALKCKLPLITVEREIKARRPELNWQGYQAGEMYRIILTVEEYVGVGYQGGGVFGEQLPTAKSTSSILFRCFLNEESEDTGSIYKAHDYTPVQWNRDPATNVVVPMEAGKYATVNVVNAKAGMTDYRGDTKVFDLYYQWWEVQADGTPIRMIAGTDNYYVEDGNDANGDYGDHSPEGWNVGKDGKTYCNTVDPNDPLASTYKYNGLPGTSSTKPTPAKWENWQLHAYIAGTVTKNELTKDGTDDLHLSNNKIFQHNSDRCYIPEDMDGKYIRVKVIAQNVRWPVAYDSFQTFWSHIYQIPGVPEEPLTGSVTASYASGKTYGTYDKPVTLSVTGFSGLRSSEKITSVYYWTDGRSKEFTGLSISDPSKIPNVKFPNDFYSADKDLSKVSGRERKAYAIVTTSKGRSFTTEQIRFQYEVEATAIARVGNATQAIMLSNIINGTVTRRWVFMPNPNNATVGWSFKNNTNTNPSVATLHEDGFVYFEGVPGETTISVKGPDNKTVSVTVQVFDTVSRLDIKSIKAPTVGQTLPTDVTIPENSKYHVSEVFWTIDSKDYTKLPATTKAQNYHSYTMNVVLEPNEFCKIQSVDFPFSITAELADGTVDLVTIQKANMDWHCAPNRLWSGDNNDNKYVLRYKFNASVGGASNVVDKIYLDFPTEVYEGENVSEWMKNVHVYTNGDNDAFEFRAEASYDTYAFEIAEAYGDFNLASNELNTFIPGVQSGVMGNITIPWALQADFPENSCDITVYVNGEPVGSVYSKSTRHLLVSAFDTLTVLPGNQIEPMPMYTVKPLNLVIGQTVDVADLLECDDPRVTIRLDSVLNSLYNAEDLAEFISWDTGTGTITPIKAITGGSSIDKTVGVYVRVELDANGDGIPEYSFNEAYPSRTLYASESEIPATPTYDPYHVTVLDPEGNEVNSFDAPYRGLAVPEVENAIISAVTNADYQDPTKNLLSYNTNQNATHFGEIVQAGFINAGDHLTIHTLSADDIHISAGETSVYAYFQNDAREDALGIMLSVDGEHFVLYDCITGLEPNTEYMLYYKQGVNGTVYSKPFRTSNHEYGVYVGRSIVTESNLGNLERDGWHYDPETEILTLKDINFMDKGVDAEAGMLFTLPIRMRAGILSRGGLTLELIGDNYVSKVSTDLVNTFVHAEQDLTIQGNGNLTMNRDGECYGLYSDNGNIYLNGTGTQTFDRLNCAYYAPMGNIYYQNGTIEYVSRVTIGYMVGNMVLADQVDRLDFSGKTHAITISVGNANGQYTTVTEEELREQIQYNVNTSNKDEKAHVRIVPTHSDVKKVATAEYLKSGSCDKASTYYYSCACGHISTKTFTQPAGSHDLVHHEASPATCISQGWDAYDTCSKCNYTTFQAIPALGHNWKHYSEKAPTCTVNGYPAYDKCQRCELSTKVTIPSGLSDLERSQQSLEIRKWFSTGHDLKKVDSTAPTCTKDGTVDHYECVHCGKLYADEAAKTTLTKAELAAPALGHAWTPWETASGTRTRTCSRCGETERETLLAAPVITLQAVASTGKSKLTWEAVEGAAKYEVWRTSEKEATDPKPFFTTKLSYTNTAAKAGDKVWYRVRAIDADGNAGPFSSSKYRICDLSQPVVKGSNVDSSGKVKLTWEAIEGATGYEIYRSTSKTSGYELLKTAAATATTFTNTGAVAGTTYYYKVIALHEKSAANSAESAVVTRTCHLAQPVPKGSNVAATGYNKLTWEAVDKADKYEVYRATAKAGPFSKMSTTAKTEYVNTSSKAGTTYYYKVKAIYSAKTTANSADSAIVTRTAHLPRPVVKASNVAATGKIKLTWEAIDGAAGYEIYRSTSKTEGFTLLKTAAATATSFTNTGAAAGTTYYYKVKAIHSNTTANSAETAVITRTCHLAQPVCTIALSGGKPKVTWKAVEGAKEYKVYRCETADGTYKVMKTTTDLSYTNTGAAKDTTYYYKVLAVAEKSAANSAYSAVVSIKATK